MAQIDEIERCLRDGSALRRIRLPETMAPDFLIADREQRRRQAVWGMLLGLFFYSALLAIDWLLVPDVYALNVAVRLGIGIPLGLIVVRLLSRPSLSLAAHQWGVALFGYTCVLTICLVMMQSANPAALAYFSMSFVVLCFTINLVGLTTVAAAVLCLIATVTAAGLIALSPFGSPGVVSAYGVIGLMVTITCVFANWCLANQSRRDYLVVQRDRLRLREISRQRDLLETLAAIDPLTGLANRRGFDAMMASDLTGRNEGTPLILAMIDIDFFKVFNDTYGHARGDDALRIVARALAEAAPDDARVARMGGEEFVLAVVGPHHLPPSAIGERLCRAVADQAIPHSGNAASSVVTISVGLASGRVRADPDHSDLFAIADDALYAAKRGGRNRAVSVIAATAGAEPDQPVS
ncbi:GGDEF domain-containing protein [Methylobacterium sp. J-090]|uniref:GGDEF domain-containing protein n=1 Tax=Methylobacterium sp. J-090 TaxID=2836666 RepID=UPI001FBBA103|nr:GGDEF domain-containing protein [Methylobacterium sp. J-090]MCJ2081127.1 GGDEF domain-containing protein [Methylobacterium sp. J-090]